MTKQEIKILKASLSIGEVIGRYVKLTRTGRLLTGLCPFHGDRHPSLSVNPEKGTFICYACGEKGDVFGFVQKIEGLSFSETLKRLTNRLAVDSGQLAVKEDNNERNKNACSDKNNPSLVNTDAKQLPAVTCQLPADLSTFLSSLQPCGSGNSELTPAWLDFEVGYSSCHMEGSMKAMRNRLVFPIRDEEGRLVGFAARRLSDGNPDIPKYINSASSDLFHKSELLYGLYRAKEAIRREGCVFVVEGYKDVLAMHAAGFIHTVALCGTALCPGHIALLRKYTSSVYLLLDGDRAGRKAAEKVSAMLLEAGQEVFCMHLPEGEDPDLLFRRLGKEAFVSFIRKAVEETAPSEEQVLLQRLRKGIRLLAVATEPAKRKRLLETMHICLFGLAGLSRDAGRPATMDWRWV